MLRRLAERTLPERTITALDIRRRRGHWRRRGVIAIHVPKAAGTSLQTLLYGRPLGHFRAQDVARLCPDLWASCPTLAVVRDPLDRLISAWRFARQGRTAEMGIRDPDRYRVPAFETFERFVEEWLTPQDLTTLDAVFRPQSGYLTDPSGEIMVDHVLRLETLAENIAALPAIFGSAPAIPKLNRSAGTRPEVSPAIADRVRALYAQDYARLGYG